MAELAYWEALRRAHDEELAHDPLVIAMGEDIGVAGGTYKVTLGLYDKYGEERIIDTPISENSYTGIGIGASMAGMRPIIEIMSINFALLALDTLINAAAKIHYMSGGRVQCPIVMRTPGGTAHQLGAQHSARLSRLFMGTPGLRVVTPSTPLDAYGMLKSAVRCNDPVIFLEHESMYNLKGEVPDEETFRPLEGAEVVREGTDITLIGYNYSVHWCLAAADRLAQEGIHAEVIDLRSLKPIDRETIRRSIEKTHRVLVAEEDEAPVGVGSEVIAGIIEDCFFALDAQPVRVHAADVPVPYNYSLEKAAIPDVKDVYQSALKVLGKV
ncbi:alpha-ketoacid dehydrogenase subunit beta [Nitrosococcus watsonii]|uniref:2-oxoisovalerate dehydrogenase subunit beta n=1 Tax=Nitrosococcus watsoni (strain C-113) TaxID=105559 RepID=D8K4U5_NITWC|nr:alpha-ketoacid dehydrogenase subunit beta [Nitrosococcus watsonii]ADJ27922.1 Transketolase central region [Nitrosococcus watsonii C-113]